MEFLESVPQVGFYSRVEGFLIFLFLLFDVSFPKGLPCRHDTNAERAGIRIVVGQRLERHT